MAGETDNPEDELDSVEEKLEDDVSSNNKEPNKHSKKIDGKDKASTEDKKTLVQKTIAEIPFFLKLAAFLLVFWTTIFGHYKIPSESMQPTLEVGDHLFVAKYAYGYSRHSLPVGLHHIPLPDGRIFSSLPKRGDVVVFRHPYQKIVMIKRVVGLPGDKIRMIKGRLYVNDIQIDRNEIDVREYVTFKEKAQVGVRVYEEQFDGEDEPHLIYERGDGVIMKETGNRGQALRIILKHDNTGIFEVPPDHLFFMGDNRDGSADSRANVTPDDPEESGPGMVHMNYVIGRADMVMFSRYRCQKPGPGIHCADKRFFSWIK